MVVEFGFFAVLLCDLRLVLGLYHRVDASLVLWCDLGLGWWVGVWVTYYLVSFDLVGLIVLLMF